MTHGLNDLAYKQKESQVGRLITNDITVVHKLIWLPCSLFRYFMKQQECLSALCRAIFKVEEVIVVNAQI